jgi:hypothetical protein
MTDHIKKNFKIQWDQIKMMFWHPSLNPKVVSSYIFEIYGGLRWLDIYGKI